MGGFGAKIASRLLSIKRARGIVFAPSTAAPPLAMDTQYDAVRARCRAYMARETLRQYQVANAINCHQSTVSRWINKSGVQDTSNTTERIRAWLDRVAPAPPHLASAPDSARAAPSSQPPAAPSSPPPAPSSPPPADTPVSLPPPPRMATEDIYPDPPHLDISGRNDVEPLPATMWEVHAPAPEPDDAHEDAQIERITLAPPTDMVPRNTRGERLVALRTGEPPPVSFDDLAREFGRLTIDSVAVISASHARTRGPRREGEVYIARVHGNPLMHKIGRTAHGAAQRIRAMQTGNPGLELVASYRVRDAPGVEEAAQAILAAYRMHAGAGREWYECTLLVACLAVAKAISDVEVGAGDL
jgi:hypothetical protein